MGNYMNFGNDNIEFITYTYDLEDEEVERELIDSTHKKNWYFYFGNRYNEDTIALEDPDD